jgi:hypothetical protein
MKSMAKEFAVFVDGEGNWVPADEYHRTRTDVGILLLEDQIPEDDAKGSVPGQGNNEGSSSGGLAGKREHGSAGALSGSDEKGKGKYRWRCWQCKTGGFGLEVKRCTRCNKSRGEGDKLFVVEEGEEEEMGVFLDMDGFSFPSGLLI